MAKKSKYGKECRRYLNRNKGKQTAKKKKPPAVPLRGTARVAYRFGSSSIQWSKNWKFPKFYPTIFGFIQPFPVIRFIPNLSNRFSGDIQPFGSNQIQIPPFLRLSNRFVDIQSFPDLSNHFLRSDSFPIYPTLFQEMSNRLDRIKSKSHRF